MKGKEYFLRDIHPITNEAEFTIRNTYGVSDLFRELQKFDYDTFIHCESVARLCVIVGKDFGYTRERLIRLAISGYLHDIGKLEIGIEIIGKKDYLTEEEYQSVKKHSDIGYSMLKPYIRDDEILHGVLEHHERLDGGGYSNHLTGESISDFGKIIAAVDVFDAMTSVRPYKKAIDCKEALGKMRLSGGFDSNVFNKLKELYSGGEDYDIRILDGKL